MKLDLAIAALSRRDGEARWAFLVRVLKVWGPTTTGELGHIYGIGENVRGIRREANVNLRGRGMEIVSEPTFDDNGRRLPWATYRLVDKRLVPHLARTAAEVGRRAAIMAAIGPRLPEPAEQGRLLP